MRDLKIQIVEIVGHTTFEISTLLPYNHRDEKHGQADQWWAYITNKTQNRILFFTS